MGLLELPKELRDHIFSYILIKPQNTITMLSNSHCFQSEVSASQPTISKVNKQLRAETLPIFYSSNTFLAELSDPEDLTTAKNWLAALGDRNIRHLRHLILSGWTNIEHHEPGMQTTWRYRYVRMVFDLREGVLELEKERWAESQMSPMPCAMWWIDELMHSFREMMAAKGKDRFTAEDLRGLMEGFHGFCASV